MADTDNAKARWWVSWWSDDAFGGFILNWPWWTSGSRFICAAIIAADEAEVREIVAAAYNTRPARISFRFIDRRADDWSPFGDRFAPAPWMQWPGEVQSNG